MKKYILFVIMFLFSFITTNANFNPVKSTLYFENINTKEITYYDTISYNMKSLIDLYFLKYLDWKSVWIDLVFGDWLLKEYCIEKDCYSAWIINKWLYAIYLDRINNDDVIVIKDNRNKSLLSEFSISNIKFQEKFNILYIEIFKNLVLEFIIFLPLNLYVFFFFGYLIYNIFTRYIKKNSYIFIYIFSFIWYLISFILLYWNWLWFINYNTVNFGFMSYFMIIWFPKFILFFLSKDLLKKYKKNNNIKSNFEIYILYCYLILFVIFVIYMNLF